MKVCNSCGEDIPGKQWVCPSCDFEPRLLEGYPAFAPELASGNDGFQEDYFEQLERIEEGHFWFRSRNRLILAALQRYFPDAGNFLEIGCGTGFVLSGLEQALPHLKLSGSEVSGGGLRSASVRLRMATLFQMDARRIPFRDEFDVVGVFDVLEHITEDETVLSQIYRALGPGGGIIAIVPQHPLLWSSWDDISCHKRRYRRRELTAKMRRAGFKVILNTSFFTFLLPLMALSKLGISRRAAKQNELNLSAAFAMPAPVDKLCEKICDLERGLLMRGLSFPFGGSRLCVGVKD